MRELVNGRVRGHEDLKIARAIEFNRNLKADEYVLTDNLFKTFKAFTLADETNKLTEAQLDKARDFIARQLRYDISTASYGTVTAAGTQRRRPAVSKPSTCCPPRANWPPPAKAANPLESFEKSTHGAKG